MSGADGRQLPPDAYVRGDGDASLTHEEVLARHLIEQEVLIHRLRTAGLELVEQLAGYERHFPEIEQILAEAARPWAAATIANANRGATTREQVKALHAAKVPPWRIAALVGRSERRVRQILAERK